MSDYPHHQPPMIDPPSHGRIFALPMRPLLGDCAPSGRMRLDALARWLQDVAYADIEDVGLEQVAVWVLRRTRLRVTRFPRFGERFHVHTFASGIGRMWAERRTTITPDPEAAGSAPAHSPPCDLSSPAATPVVEAVSVWIHLDPERWVPTPLSQAELAVYADTAGTRHFSHRLVHPKPDVVESEVDWVFRRSDLDLADHVNNAAYWEPLEEELLADGADPGPLDAEIEFRTPAQPGHVRLLRAGLYRWLTEPGSDEVYASMLLTGAGGDGGAARA